MSQTGLKLEAKFGGEPLISVSPNNSCHSSEIGVGALNLLNAKFTIIYKPVNSFAESTDWLVSVLLAFNELIETFCYVFKSENQA